MEVTLVGFSRNLHNVVNRIHFSLISKMKFLHHGPIMTSKILLAEQLEQTTEICGPIPRRVERLSAKECLNQNGELTAVVWFFFEAATSC